MYKILITLFVVFGLAIGGFLNLSPFTDITPDAIACGDKDKGSSEGTDSSSDSGAQT